MNHTMLNMNNNVNGISNNVLPDTYLDACSFNTKFPEDDYCNSFSLAHFNCRSLPRNYDNLNMYLTSLVHKFKIIGVTETWLNASSPLDSYCLDGYKFLCNNRKSKRGGGTGIYIHKSLHCFIRHDLTVINDSFECIFIELSNNSKCKKTVIGVIYRPPERNTDVFLNEFSHLLNKINVRLCNCFIMGDLNLDLTRIGLNSKIDSFIDLLSSFCLQPVIDSPTRITQTSASLLDNIFTNVISPIQSGILLCDISDHLAIFSIFSAFSHEKNTSTPTGNHYKRIFNDSNLQSFFNKISNVSWNDHLLSDDVDEKYNTFLQIFKDNYEECFPLKSFSQKRKLKNPWITNDLLKLCRKKSILYKKYLQNPSDYRKEKYKKYRNFVTIKVRQAKREYFNRIFNESKDNIKLTWKLINNLLNKNKKNEDKKIESLEINNETMINKQEIANSFNDFFVSIGTKLKNSKINSTAHSYQDYLKSPNKQTIFLKPITSDEIITIVDKMKNNTSSGIDEIDVKVVKYVISLICVPLASIFNDCLTCGTFPKKMKIARVTPIHKKGKQNDVNNYRPISVLPIFSKILEKCVYKRLIEFLDKNNILHRHQFGFRQGHSTATAILDLIHKINQAIDDEEYALTVFIDLTKAFDVIDHFILLRKLYYYGIRGTPLKLFTNYLSDRKQLTVIDGVSSNLKEIKCGVPQGSILGPLLFLIYINDLPHSTQNLHYVLFADDTSVFCKGSDPRTLFDYFNVQLHEISNWMKANNLILNIAKTNYMLFGTRTVIETNLNLYYENENINRVSNTKFLGVFIDERLSWNHHIDNLCNTLSKNVGILYRMQYLPQNILKMLYHSLVSCHVNYCNVIWGFTSKKNIERVGRLLKRAIRVITHSPYLSPSTPLFLKTKILPINDLISLEIAKFMFKLHKNLLPEVFNNYFILNSSVHNYNTRNAKNIHPPFNRTSMSQSSIFYHGSILWNNLPNFIKCSKTFNQFKRLYKKQLFDKLEDSM